MLGIAPTSSRSEIKAQFHRLVRLYHPDLSPDGSPYLLQRVIGAAEAVLNAIPKMASGEASGGGSASATGHERPRTRYEKQKQKQANSKEAKQRVLDEVELYTGHGRMHGPTWSIYRITMGKIEISQPIGGYDRWRGRKSEKAYRFQDVRRISSHVDLQDNRCDLELELVWDSRVTLERLPQDVAAQIERYVEAAQLRFQARRATMLGRLV